MFLQRQKQEKNKNSKEILRAQMEPDLHVLSGSSEGISWAHAGNHVVGPSQGEGRGKWISWRGKANCKSNFFGVIHSTSTAMDLTPSKRVKSVIVWCNWQVIARLSRWRFPLLPFAVLADSHWAGNSTFGWWATLVQTADPWCVLYATPTFLPKHTAQAASRRESHAAATK